VGNRQGVYETKFTFNFITHRTHHMLSFLNFSSTIVRPGLVRAFSKGPAGYIVGKLAATTGSSIDLTHTYSQKEITGFAELSGDTNPIHVDPKFAANTPFGKTIVHGIYSSSLFSRMLGSTVHGSVYVGQTLRFLKPIFTDNTVKAKIEVVQVEKRKRGSLLTCSTTVHILQEDSIPVLAVVGEAQVLVPF